MVLLRSSSQPLSFGVLHPHKCLACVLVQSAVKTETQYHCGDGLPSYLCLCIHALGNMFVHQDVIFPDCFTMRTVRD